MAAGVFVFRVPLRLKIPTLIATDAQRGVNCPPGFIRARIPGSTAATWFRVIPERSSGE